jgi:NADH-quinone oxidoreductase subunit C
MRPEDVADRLAEAVKAAARSGEPGGEGDVAGGSRPSGEPGGEADLEIGTGVDDGREWRRAVVDVPAAVWRLAARTARDDPDLDLSYFDWLSGVDEQDGGFGVVAHLWSVPHRHGALLRTRVPRVEPRLPSLVPVFPGASWHERETYEMFGVIFDGHPDLRPLLLPDGFAGHPLRKDFVLASRVAKEWPGAKEPGESHTGATRRRMRPPGVPEDWPRDA